MTKIKEFLRLVSEHGCIVCHKLGNFYLPPAEIHHPRTNKGMSQRSNDLLAIALCPIHHRLGTCNEATGYQYSIHLTPKKFIELYGTEKELYALQAKKMNYTNFWNQLI
jgi:Recombination enhancement, RecA-dependent nuclease